MVVSFDEFKKIELKAGQILSVEDVEGKDRLFKLRVDIGTEITLVAGLKQFYSREELLGRKIIVVANLAPAKIGGIESQGMLLAGKDSGGKYCIATIDANVPNGTLLE